MDKKFVSVGSLKKGGYVLIEDTVCKINDIEKSKPGKHGGMKARITATDIFSGQKKQLLKPVDADAEVPIIEKSDAQVVAIMGKMLQLMDLKTYETFEIPVPEEFKNLTAGMEVEYQKAGTQVSITRIKG